MIIRKWMVALAISAFAATASAQQQTESAHNHSADNHAAHGEESAQAPEAADDLQYVCPMLCVPAQDTPGNCPVCEMQLVKTDQVLGPHGGLKHRVGSLEIETVVEPGGIRLFAYDLEEQPHDVRTTRGIATLQIAGDAKRYRYDLFPEILQDESAESLGVAVDLSKIAGHKIDLTFQILGLVEGKQQPAEFSASIVAPMTEAQQVAAAIEKQKVCPVSGQPLGGMGKPIPVTVGGQTVYVCCAGCIYAVKENPAKYFPQQQVQLTVTKATEADAKAIKLQKLCPVMDEPLGGMGTPLKVTGLGRDVYLCCKGCLKFLEEEPQKYLAKLPPLPESENPKVVKATEADAQAVDAQKLCPVMDEPLDAMGGPYKTIVEGHVVFLCCPGCAKKLHADPAGYLDKLAKQGVTPPAVE